MNISEELVRELQSKIDISYEEAEAFLKKTRGNVDHAYQLIIERRNSGWTRFKDGFAKVIMDLMQYRFVLTRKQEVLVNLPILLLVGIFIVLTDERVNGLFWILVLFVLALATECEMKIKKRDDKGKEPYVKEKGSEPVSAKNVATPTSSTVTEQVVILEAPSVVKSVEPEKKDDDFYEIVIEE